MRRDEETVARIAQRLRERRAELGLTQAEFAEQLGVTQAYLSRLETAEATTQVRRLVRALNAVGLDLVALPRQHPTARVERMRPLTPPRRHTSSQSLDALQAVLDGTDLGAVSNSAIAERLRMLREFLAHRDEIPGVSAQVRDLVGPLRRLAQNQDALDVASPEVRKALTAIRDTFPPVKTSQPTSGTTRTDSP